MNSLESHLKLLSDTECDVILTPENRLPIADELLSRRPMRNLTVSSLSDLLLGPNVSVYRYNKDYSEARHEPFMVLHSSGSTGLPKPIILNNGTLTLHDLFLDIPERGGKPIMYSRFAGKRMFLGFPLYHSAAMCFLVYSVYSGTIPMLPPSFPPSADVVNKALIDTNCSASFTAPMVLVETCRNAQYLENVKRLQYVAYGGAPLTKELGNKLKEHVHLFMAFGSTETGMWPLECLESEDWEYLSFSPFMGYELRPYSKNLSELVFVQRKDLQDFQGAFATFPELQEYSANDLFSKHPTKEGLWLYEGRADDIIVLSGGMNIHPGNIEGMMNAHPAVKSAILCGRARPRTVLIVEAHAPAQTADKRAELLQSIWPSIERANLLLHNYGQITKDRVLFTSSEKPMLRTAKGSVQRMATEHIYKDELDGIFTSLGL